jgi:hypothetical protein
VNNAAVIGLAITPSIFDFRSDRVNPASNARRRFVYYPILILATLGILVFCEYLREQRSIMPLRLGSTIEEFAVNACNPVHLSVTEERLVWIGKPPGPLSVSSGGPCYVFDLNGTLESWVPETGEGGKLDHISRLAFQHESVSVDEALALIRENRLAE